MNEMKKALFFGFSLAALFCLAGFDSRPMLAHSKRVNTNEVSRHIALLKSRDAQQKAAAAYWLGLQRSSASSAVNPLVSLLGDETEVDASRYLGTRTEVGIRHPRKLTVGEEAAAALVNIGRASTDALIEVLKSSPEPHARKNAAWALGAIREDGVDDGPQGVRNVTRSRPSVPILFS